MTRIEEYRELLKELETEPAKLSFTTERCLSRVRRKRRSLWWKVPCVAVIASFFLFITLLNTSVAFARSVGEMPLLRDLAEYMTFDPSLKAAVENKYVQPVELSGTDNGLTFTLHYLIADRKRLVIFYTLSDQNGKPIAVKPESGLDLMLDGIKDQNGKKLEIPYVSGGMAASGPGFQQYNIDFSDVDLPDSFVLDLSVTKDTFNYAGLADESRHPELARRQFETLASYSFPLHIEKIDDAQEIDVEKQVTVQGQKFTIKEVKIFPTTTTVTLEADSDNTAVLRQIGLSLKDEKGRVWGRGAGMISMEKDDDKTWNFYLASSYFSGARHLTLSINDISLLPKEEQYVKVDLAKGTAGPLPDNIVMQAMEKQGDKVYLTFVRKTDADYEIILLFNGPYYDGSGKSYNFGTSQNYAQGLSDVRAQLPAGTYRGMAQKFCIEHTAGGVLYLERSYAPTTTLKIPIEIELK